MPEQTIWTGTSSQITNAGAFLLALLLLAAGGIVWTVFGPLPPMSFVAFALLGLGALCLLRALVRWVKVRTRVFELTTERLLITSGILSKTKDTLELYRVRDMRTTQPFIARLFGLQHIVLITNDTSSPEIVLNHVPASAALADRIREQVEACRVRKNVREIDVDMPPTL